MPVLLVLRQTPGKGLRRANHVAMRSQDKTERRPIRRLLGRLIAAPGALSIIWPLLLVVGGFAAWNQWGADFLADKYHGVDPSLIEITETPVYVRSNLVETVYRDTALDGLSLLDAQATAKIASAFASHPWVRGVNSVRKLPGGVIDVRIDYRVPVAMVHVISRHPEVTGSSFFAVDGEGVLLPTNEFSRSDTNNYVHIDVPSAYPTGVVGTAFGDLRVEAAAKLAAILAPVRTQIGVKVIGVPGDWRESVVPQLELTTTDDVRLFWGSPPGYESPGERTAAMKLQALLAGDFAENTDLRIARLPAPQ